MGQAQWPRAAQEPKGRLRVVLARARTTTCSEQLSSLLALTLRPRLCLLPGPRGGQLTHLHPCTGRAEAQGPGRPVTVLDGTGLLRAASRKAVGEEEVPSNLQVRGATLLPGPWSLAQRDSSLDRRCFGKKLAWATLGLAPTGHGVASPLGTSVTPWTWPPSTWACLGQFFLDLF